MSDNCVEAKSDFLGRTYGGAMWHLRKSVMFSLVQALGLDICFRCHAKIANAADLSIDHKQPWLHVSRELFWDVGNIAFSHTNCNSVSRRKPKAKIQDPPGYSWCSKHKQFLPVENFGPAHTDSRNGLNRLCRACHGEKNKAWRKKTGYKNPHNARRRKRLEKLEQLYPAGPIPPVRVETPAAD